MINVLYLCPVFPPDYTGYGIHLRRRLPLLRKFGINPWLMTRKQAGLPVEELVDDILVRRIISRRNSAFPASITDLFLAGKMLKYRNEIDLVITPMYGSVGFLLKDMLHIPIVREIVIAYESDGQDLNRHVGGLRAFLFRRMDRLISLSPRIAEQAVSLGFSREKIHLISHGVDELEFRQAESREEKLRLRREMGLPGNSNILFVSVGGIQPRKGIIRMIEAWNRVVKNERNLHLALAGPLMDKPYHEKVIEKISEKGLQNNIHLLGYTERIPELLRCADGFLFCSYNEGFPGAILEAMACGLPIVAYNIPGILSHAIHNGENGILLDEEDPTRMAEQILMLARDNELSQRLGAAARRTIEQRFSIEAEAAAHAKLYREVLKR